MTCEEIAQALPDYTLGTLSEVESAAVRRHLRGCGPCRQDAARLDEGMTMFASAVHEVEPPPQLRDRVHAVLGEEWREAPEPARRSRRWGVPAIAAAVILLAGAMTWGAVAQTNANRARDDAASYQQFLQALGGLDVRVATLRPVAASDVQGSAVLYDSDKGQSWVLVLARSPQVQGPLTVLLTTADGKTIRMHPIELDSGGQGSSWLVTSADISGYTSVTVSGPDGAPLASGTASAG